MAELHLELWTAYRKNRNPEARQALVEQYLGLVHSAARRMVRRVSDSVEYDDLLSAGTIGLLQAMETYDLSRGLAFSTYAMRRIQGAMLDELRSRDWVPRSVRLRGRQMAAATRELERLSGRPPAAREVADALSVSVDTYWRWHRDVDGAALLSLQETAREERAGAGPIETAVGDPGSIEFVSDLCKEEAATALHDCLNAMPERDRLVLSLYFFKEMKLREIAGMLGVTESRISQIRASALKRLRGRMELAQAA